MPIALISLIDRDRQFFKSQTGLPEDLATARQTARNVSVCGHVVAKNQVMVIEDLARDRRLANNPQLKEHGIRFYAGVPLLAPNGQPIGSLCLLDMKPRQLAEREKRLLQEYANEVMEEIAKRAPQLGSGDVPVAAIEAPNESPIKDRRSLCQSFRSPWADLKSPMINSQVQSLADSVF